MSGRVVRELRQSLSEAARAADGRRSEAHRALALGGFTDDPRSPPTLFLDGSSPLVTTSPLLRPYSMAHSLEVRVPFLDQHVVELCASIPARLTKVHGASTTKHLLKEGRARPRP